MRHYEEYDQQEGGGRHRRTDADCDRLVEIIRNEQGWPILGGGTHSEPVSATMPPARIVFRVDGIPIAQPRQRHRIVQPRGGKAFVHNYTPAKSPIADFKARVAWAAKQAYCGEPLTIPVRVEIVAIFPAPSSFRVAQRREIQSGLLLPYTGRNDWDNIGKAVCDALNGVLWDDDRRIYDGRVGRYYGSAPGVTITVWRDGQGVGES